MVPGVPGQVPVHIVPRNSVCSPPLSRPRCWSANQTVQHRNKLNHVLITIGHFCHTIKKMCAQDTVRQTLVVAVTVSLSTQFSVR